MHYDGEQSAGTECEAAGGAVQSAEGGGARVGGRGGGGGGVVQQKPAHCIQTPCICSIFLKFKLLTWRPALLALTPSVQNPTFHPQFQALVALE